MTRAPVGVEGPETTPLQAGRRRRYHEGPRLTGQRVHRAAALAFLRRVRGPLVVVTSTAELEERAIRDWIERYHDQDFSLADAVSFTVMAERGIKEALTLDRQFLVAGYRTRPAL